MEENLKKYDDLNELMKKIDESMNLSRKKQEKIDKSETKLNKETKVVMVDKEKEEINVLKQNKEEFDEMSKNAMIEAKKEILVIRAEAEKQYQEKLLETMKKQNEITTKLESMRKRYTSQEELDSEKLEMAEKSAEKVKEELNNSMKEFQKEHFERMSKLDQYELNINDYAIELGIVEEISNVNMESIEKERKEAENSKNTAEAEKAEEENSVKGAEGSKKEESDKQEKSEEGNAPKQEENDKKESNQEGKATVAENSEKVENAEKTVGEANKNNIENQNVKYASKQNEGVIIEEAFERLEINANDGSLKILFTNEKLNKEIPLQEIIETKSDLYKRIEMNNILKEYCEGLGLSLFDKLSLKRKINPAIITAIDRYGAENDYEKYFDALLSKNNVMPFYVKYDLKNSTMNESQFKLMNKYAKHDRDIEGVTAEGVQKNWFEKLVDRIKGVKLLDKGNEEVKEEQQEGKRQNFLKDQELSAEEKEKVEKFMQQYKEEQSNVKEETKNTHLNTKEIGKVNVNIGKNNNEEGER